MSLYYQDDFVTLYHGDSLEVLPTLDIKADVLLTDPCSQPAKPRNPRTRVDRMRTSNEGARK